MLRRELFKALLGCSVATRTKREPENHLPTQEETKQRHLAIAQYLQVSGLRYFMEHKPGSMEEAVDLINCGLRIEQATTRNIKGFERVMVAFARDDLDKRVKRQPDFARRPDEDARTILWWGLDQEEEIQKIGKYEDKA